MEKEKRWRLRIGRIVESKIIIVIGKRNDGLEIGIRVERSGKDMKLGNRERIEDIERMIEEGSGEIGIEEREDGRINEKEKIVRKVEGEESIKIGGMNIGEIGREVMDFVELMKGIVEELVKDIIGIGEKSVIKVKEKGIVIVDGIGEIEKNEIVINEMREGIEEDRGIGDEEEMVEVEIGEGKLKGLREKVEIKELIEIVEKVVFEKIIGDMEWKGRRRKMKDDMREIGNRRIKEIGREKREKMIVILENMDFIEVKKEGLIDIEKMVKKRRKIEKEGRGMREWKSLKKWDIKRLGWGKRR